MTLLTGHGPVRTSCPLASPLQGKGVPKFPQGNPDLFIQPTTCLMRLSYMHGVTVIGVVAHLGQIAGNQVVEVERAQGCICSVDYAQAADLAQSHSPSI